MVKRKIVCFYLLFYYAIILEANILYLYYEIREKVFFITLHFNFIIFGLHFKLSKSVHPH